MALRNIRFAFTCVCIIIPLIGLLEAEHCAVPSKQDAQAYFILVSDDPIDCAGGNESELVNYTRQTLAAINDGSSLQFGVQVIPSCGNPEAGKLSVWTEISKQLTSGNCQDSISNASTLIGVISSYNLDLAEALISTNLPFITIGEPHYQSDQANKTTFNVGTILEQRAKVIAKLAAHLNWDYSTVVLGSDKASRDLRPLLEEQLRENLVCIDSFKELSETDTSNDVIQAISGVGKPKAVILAGIPDQMMESLTSRQGYSWLISSTSSSNVSLSRDASSADGIYTVHSSQTTDLGVANLDQLMSAIYSLTTAVEDKCSSSLSACRSKLEDLVTFRENVIENLMSVEVDFSSLRGRARLPDFYTQRGGTFKFSSDGVNTEPELPMYTISEAGEMGQGYYYRSSGGRIEGLDTVRNDNTRYMCTNEECRKKCIGQIKPDNYIFVPGKYIVVITAPIHDRFNKYPDLYTCIDFNDENSLRAEAVLFAREQLKTLIPELDIGLLILDTCYNTALAQKLLADIFNGTTDYCYEGECLDRSKIVGLVADYSSHITVAEQQMIIPANIIQVAYGAATWRLDDKKRYSHFLRTHPTNSRISTNVVKILDELNSSERAEINSAVVIQTNSEYGESGGELIMTKLLEANYCILENFTLDYEESQIVKYREIWNKLSVYDHSLVVIFNGEEHVITELLDNIGDEREWWLRGGSIFILTEGWEDRELRLQQYGSLLRGTLSLKIADNFQVPGYRKHLQAKYVSNDDINPWFTKMYQRERECKIRGEFSNSSSDICSTTQPFTNKEIDIEIYAKYAIKTLYAFVFGFNNYAKHACGSRPVNNCPLLYNRTKESAQELKEFIKVVKIPGADNSSKDELKLFDENYDGDGGYEVYSQQKTKEQPPRPTFALVYNFEQAYGTDDVLERNPYNHPEFFKLVGDEDVAEPLNAMNCNPSKPCDCMKTVITSTTPSSPTTVLAISISFTVIVILLIAAIAVMYWRFRKAGGSDSRKQVRDNSFKTPANSSESGSVNNEIERRQFPPFYNDAFEPDLPSRSPPPIPADRPFNSNSTSSIYEPVITQSSNDYRLTQILDDADSPQQQTDSTVAVRESEYILLHQSSGAGNRPNSEHASGNTFSPPFTTLQGPETIEKGTALRPVPKPRLSQDEGVKNVEIQISNV